MKVKSGFDRWPKWGFGFKVWDAHGFFVAEVAFWKVVAWVEVHP